MLILSVLPEFQSEIAGKPYKKQISLNNPEDRFRMKLIQIKGGKKNKVDGCYALITNGTVRCLKDDKYKVPGYCLDLLREKGIEFVQIKE